MKGLLNIIFVATYLCSFPVFSQTLTEVKVYPISEEAVWTVDGLENIIISDRDRLTKFDKNGKLLFEQSQKAYGRFDKVEMVNSLKMYAFSETQQVVCFFDNSLSTLEKCIDLSEYDVINVSTVAASGQSDKMWVFDQVNSTLHLLSFNNLLQTQQIKNLNGILNADNIDQLLEWDNKLFLLDNKKGVYVLDVYGTLIRFIEFENLKWIQLFNEHIICLKGNQLKMISLQNEKSILFTLPYENVQEIFVDDNYIYFRNKSSIIKAKFVF